MKITLLAIVLAVAFAAAAQDATQPQTQTGGQAQAPTIKDGAEYNAYVGAVPTDRTPMRKPARWKRSWCSIPTA